MTCIAAIAGNGTVWMGCDSIGSDGFTGREHQLTLPPRNVDQTLDSWLYACGSGEYHATAALHVTSDTNRSPTDRITQAIETASHFVTSVGGLIHVVSA